MNPKGSVVRGNRAVQIRAMRLHREGHPIRHIRRVTGVAKSTISEWIRNASAITQTQVRRDGFNASVRDLRD